MTCIFPKSICILNLFIILFALYIFNVVRYFFSFIVSAFSNLLKASLSLDFTQRLLDIAAIFYSVLLFTIKTLISGECIFVYGVK